MKIVEFNNLDISEKNILLLNLIKNNKYNQLKYLIRKYNISLSKFNVKNSFDILLFTIENTSSQNILQLIINNCKYPTLNYSFQYNNGIVTTPLLSSIIYTNVKITSFLLDNYCDINYFTDNFNLLYNLKRLGFLTEKIFKFLIKKGLSIKYIKTVEYYSFSYLKIITDCFIINNEFIITLLNYYKNRKELSNKKIKEIIENENFKLQFPFKWYLNSLKKEEYKNIELFNLYEGKENILIILMNLNEPLLKYKLLLKLKNNELNFIIDHNIINKSFEKAINEQRNNLSRLIKNNNINLLNYFLSENKIMLEHINSNDYDVLAYSICKNVNFDIFELIVKSFSYSIYDYNIPNNIHNAFITPLVYSLMNDRFDISSYLIIRGADINYGLLNDHNENIILEFLNNHKKLSINNTKYILNFLFEEKKWIDKIEIDDKLINNLIINKKNDIATLMIKFKHKISGNFYNKAYEISLKNYNFSMIDNLYEIDKDTSIKKLEKIIIQINRIEGGMQFNKYIYNLKGIIENQELKTQIYNFIKNIDISY